MGFQTAKEMMVSNAVQSATSRLLGEYADLFKGIGKMKGVRVDFHVDPAIRPVPQPHRRIPFSVRPKAEA